MEVAVSRSLIARVSLATMLVAGGGLLVDTPFASASTPAHHASSAPAKPNKDKKKPKVVALKLVKTPLGNIIVNAKGFTLYAFDPDGTSTVTSKCIDACANIWPAQVAPKKPVVGKGLKQKLVGIGGGGQLVYNDHLLYRYSGDSKAGQTNGQNIANIWHVLNGKGATVT
jgi:predicted lipoprotein with Yx(FWY)xxD motif